MSSNKNESQVGPVSLAEAQNIARRVRLNSLDAKKILVTGSQGLIGNYLSQALAEAMRLQGLAPSKLILQSRRPKSQQQVWAERFDFVQHLELSLDFTEIFPQVDVVVHAASPASPAKYESPSDLFAPNVSGILSSLALNRLPERLLFVSSGEVYGLHDEVTNCFEIEPRFQAAGPRSSYPNAKLAAEKILLSARPATANFRVARLFHTFGPGLVEDDGRSFADFLYSAANRKPVELYGQGLDARNFAYVEDSVVALLTILVSRGDNQVFDVAGPHRVSIRDFAELVAQLAGVKVVLGKRSVQAGRIPVQGRYPLPSTERLASLGWKPEISLEEGVRRTLEYIRSPFRTL